MKHTIVQNPAAPHALSARRRLRGFFISVGLSTLLAAPTMAGVLVAPTVVFLSEKGRTGRMTVQNPSDKPKEVTIHFSFGLPESDSLGNVTVTL
ncbi:MAG TPA: hypothetical protein VLB27_04095, partial [candidate division Zixibacteria bacterium]|nr:hypothetical protein [candidate division Zixibacteria bacterium]